MSMISSLIDRLRRAAQTYRNLGNHTAEGMFLEAADTIWELRDDLQRANAENAKLRELVSEMLLYIAYPYVCVRPEILVERARELGIEVNG